jgi:histone H3
MPARVGIPSNQPVRATMSVGGGTIYSGRAQQMTFLPLSSKKGGRKAPAPPSNTNNNVATSNVSSNNVVAAGKTPTQVQKKKKVDRGKAMIRNMKQIQRSTALIMRCAPFNRFIKKTLGELAPDKDMRIAYPARVALMHAYDSYMVKLFEDCNIAARHSKRVTMLPKDMKHVYRIKTGLPCPTDW